MTTGDVSTSFSAILGNSVQGVIGTVLRFFNNQIVIIVLLSVAVSMVLYIIGYTIFLTGIIGERQRKNHENFNALKKHMPITFWGGDVERKKREKSFYS